MKTLFLSSVILLMVVCRVSAVPVYYAHAKKISGEVTEVKNHEIYMVIRIKLEKPVARDQVREIHRALRRYTYLGFRDYRRPRHDEALLFFTTDRPKGLKVGDRVAVHDYAVVGHSDSNKKLGTPRATKVEKLPQKKG